MTPRMQTKLSEHTGTVQNMTNSPRGYAYIDVETTGFDEKSDRVIQIALVHVSADLQIEKSWVTLVNPHLRHIPAFHIHGITRQSLVGAPTFADIWPVLHERLSGRIVAAHNLPFDARMVNAEVARLGHRAPIDAAAGVDTRDLAKTLLPALPNRKLPTVCRELDVPLVNAHDALADATAGAHVMTKLLTMQHREMTGRPKPTGAGLPIARWFAAIKKHHRSTRTTTP